MYEIKYTYCSCIRFKFKYSFMKNYPKWMLLPLLNFSCGQQFIHQMVSNETTPLIASEIPLSTDAGNSCPVRPLPTSQYDWEKNMPY